MAERLPTLRGSAADGRCPRAAVFRGASMRARRLRWRAALPAALLALVLPLLGACVSDGGSGAAAGGSVMGGWTMQPDATCQESLDFQAGGSFVHGVALSLLGQSEQQLVSGSYDGGTDTGASGSLDVDLVPQAAVSDPLLAYCGQWQSATRTDLPFAALTLVLGTDPGALAWRPLDLPGGGTAWVGTDSTLADRLALVRDEDVLRGYATDRGLPAGAILYHRTPPHLPSSFPVDYPNVLAVNLPQQTLSMRSDGSAGGPFFTRLLLSVHSAVDVDFSAQAATAKAYPPCALSANSEPDLSGPPMSPDPLAGLAGNPVVTLNPGDPAGPLIPAQPFVEGQRESVYLLPIDVSPPVSGQCQVNIRARPLVARLVSTRVAQHAAEAFALQLSQGAAYLLGVPQGRPGALRAFPLQGGAGWAGSLLGQLVQPAPAAADPLGLQDGAGDSVRLSVGGNAGQRYLNVFPSQSGPTGLGPFMAHGEAAAPIPLPVPGTADVSLSGGAQADLRFTLAAAALVRLYSSGGAGTAARLTDADGNVLAGASGGAPDGAGFRLEQALAAGSYDLGVEAAQVPASFTVHLELPVADGLADARLAACLHTAGAAGTAPAEVRVADCAGQGVASLSGIGAYAGLWALRLDDDPIADLAPLVELTELRELSLAGTAPAALSPLASLPVLYRLSLARVALDAAAMAVLEGLGDRLTRLDLEGATGLGDADLAALKAVLPNTTVIAPDGTVLE
jgi:hypothetical protein